MRVYLLGPLEARVDGEPVVLSGPKQRGLLALLALRLDHVVSLESIVDALWPSRPPKTAVRQVQDLASRLRRAVDNAGDRGVTPKSLIQTRPKGYMLIGASTDVDASEFDALMVAGRSAARQGRHHTARDRFHDALSLWRGEALLDADLPVLQREARRLDEGRLEAYEAWIECVMAVGDGPAIIGRLQALVDEHPLREAFRRQLMLALHQAGRRPEALETYRTGREFLVSQLGIEPGAGLQQTHRLVLGEQEPWSGPAPVSGTTARVPRQLPPDLIDFTGRGEELHRLCDVLAVVATGATGTPINASTVIVRGGAGVGKTALAIHAAHCMAEQFPDGHLLADLRGSTGTPAMPHDVLGDFLRDLGMTPAEISDDPAARTTLFRTLLHDRRILIILDDASEDAQVLPLLPAGPHCAVLVTSQGRIDLGGYAIHVDLRPFTCAESLTLLSRVLGAARVTDEQPAAEELVDDCDRLPVAVRAAASQLADRPDWRIADLAARMRRGAGLAHPAAGTVRAWFDRGYRCLSTDGRRAFRRLGQLEQHEINLTVAQQLLETRPEVVEDVMEHLVDRYILIPRGPHLYEIPRMLQRFVYDQLAAESVDIDGRSPEQMPLTGRVRARR